VKRALFAHWKYERHTPQANKQKTSTNKSRAKQAQAQAKDKCRRRQTQAPQAAKPNTRCFGAQKSTGQCGEKIEPCFCEASVEALHLEACQKMRACVFFFFPPTQPRAFAAQSAKPPAGEARAAGGGGPRTRHVALGASGAAGFFLGSRLAGEGRSPDGMASGTQI
jgi:hypothetical protein